MWGTTSGCGTHPNTQRDCKALCCSTCALHCTHHSRAPRAPRSLLAVLELGRHLADVPLARPLPSLVSHAVGRLGVGGGAGAVGSHVAHGLVRHHRQRPRGLQQPRSGGQAGASRGRQVSRRGWAHARGARMRSQVMHSALSPLLPSLHPHPPHLWIQERRGATHAGESRCRRG